MTLKPQPLPILLVASVILPLAVFVGLSWRSHERALAAAETQVESTVLVLREHAHRVFEAQELVIERVDQLIADMSWPEIASSEEVHRGLGQIKAGLEHVDGLWLINDQGEGVNSADFFPMRTDVHDRDYLKALEARDVLYFGSVIVGKLKGNLNFNLSRRRGSPANSFDGLILVTANLSYFEGFWQAVGPELPHVAGLFRADGEILARYPALETLPPRLSSASPLIQAWQHTDSGIIRATSTLDGSRRIYGYSRIDGYPVYIGYGVDRDTVLAPWLRQTAVNGGITAVTAATLFFLVLVAMGQQARERSAIARMRAEEARRERAEVTVAEKERLLADLRRAQTERQAILDSMVEGLSVIDREGKLIYRNEPGRKLLGISADEELPSAEAIAGAFRFLTLDGSPVPPEETPYAQVLRGELLQSLEMRLADRRTGRSLVYSYNGAPLIDDHGEISGAVVTFEDVTEQRSADERQQLLIGELNHRVRNLLATIQSMVALTGSTSGSKEELQRALEGRIGAMARSHARLSEENWRGDSLRQMVTDELRPYEGGERIVIEAESDVVLRPKEAQSFALAVHELSTNAAKYGALSVPAGTLRIGWHIREEEAGKSVLRFEWRESNGPAVSPPERPGFGSMLIERVLEQDTGADVTLDYAATGLHCRIDLPTDDAVLLSSTSSDGALAASQAEAAERPSLPEARILLVEDEIMVALDIEHMLSDAGITVVGPAPTLGRAMALVESAGTGSPGLDAALVDLNLRGEIAAPLIDRLVSEKIPVLILSGYENLDLLPQGLRELPRLRKPVSQESLMKALSAILKPADAAAK